MKRTTIVLIAVATLQTGLAGGPLLQNSEGAVYRSRNYRSSNYRRSTRPYGLRPHRDFRKERQEKMEKLEKNKTAVMENELWHKEFAGMLPAGYGTVQLAHMSSETKELLKQKAEDRERAIEADRALAMERAEAARAAAAAEAAKPAIEKAALDHIKAMSAYLGRQKEFEVFADELREDLTAGQATTIQTRQHMQVARPDRLKLKTMGLGTDAEAWFDGEAFTLKDNTNDSEMAFPMETDVAGLSDALYARHGYVLPMTDLLIEDLYGQVEPYVTRARYLGVSPMGGIPCHHVAVTSGGVDWEAWIHAEGDPAPRRILLRYREQPGAPRYGLNIHSIRKLEDVADDTFAVPASAR